MIVVRRDTEASLTAAKDIVIYRRCIVIIAYDVASVVVYLHCVHADIFSVVVKCLKRPSRMVIGYEESAVLRSFDGSVDAIRLVCTAEVRFFGVKLHLVAIIQGIGEDIIGSVPKRMYVIVGFESDEAEMAGFCMFPRLVPLVDLDFKTVQRKKILVRKFGMRDKDVMVGVGYYRISLLHVHLFDFLGRFFAVGYRCVAMKICFVEISVLGEKMLYHI